MGGSDLPARLVFAVLLVFVTVLTVTPGSGDPGFLGALMQWISTALMGAERFADKFGHFFAYAALGASAYWARLPPSRRVFWAPLGLAVYGAILEGVQGLGGARNPDFADAAANAIGAIAGIAAAFSLARAFRMTAK